MSEDARTRDMQRFDLVTNYRCGSSIEEMEPSDNGDWVRFDDVRREIQSLREQLAALTAQKAIAEHHKALSLLGKSSWQEVVEDKLRVDLAECQVALEAANAKLASLTAEKEKALWRCPWCGDDVREVLKPSGGCLTAEVNGGIWHPQCADEYEQLTAVRRGVEQIEQEIRNSAGSDPSWDENRRLKKKWADALHALRGKE